MSSKELEKSSVPSLTGKKSDDGKRRFDLIPVDALEALADLYGMGAEKYGDRNWEGGFKWGRVFAAMMRHAWAWWRGETLDRQDFQHHLIAVAWCAFTLYQFDTKHDGEDDRSYTPLRDPS